MVATTLGGGFVRTSLPLDAYFQMLEPGHAARFGRTTSDPSCAKHRRFSAETAR